MSRAVVVAERVRPFWLMVRAMVVQVFMGCQYALIAAAMGSRRVSASGTPSGDLG